MRRFFLAAVAVVCCGCPADVGGVIGPGNLGPDYDRTVGELCGNLVDDDGDGSVDEDCGCEPGSVRSCYAGPAATEGVGSCSAGTQACDEHFEFPSWGMCLGSIGPSLEVIGNGIDDDCDGVVDGAPDGGAACPAGLVETYHPRHASDGWGASSIEHGDGGPSMDVTCEEASCEPGQVAVEQLGWDYGEDDYGGDPWAEPTPKSELLCVAPPPECPDGTYPAYRDPMMWDEFSGFDDRGFGAEGGASEMPSGWRCDPPCDLIVQYGALYGSLVVCTDLPTLSCPGGQVPTFVFESESWQCAPLCDNGLYDQIWLDDAVLCVPC